MNLIIVWEVNRRVGIWGIRARVRSKPNETNHL